MSSDEEEEEGEVIDITSVPIDNALRYYKLLDDLGLKINGEYLPLIENKVQSMIKGESKPLAKYILDTQPYFKKHDVLERIHL